MYLKTIDKPIVSLIIATYNRYKEVRELLQSLTRQDVLPSVFEVIIIDQNDKIDLVPLINYYSSKFSITYVHSSEKGLSKAKNKGIELAKGSILTFSDDDCIYYPDTIRTTLNVFEENQSIDVIYGKIYDRKNNKNIMRSWKNKPLMLNKFNFHLNYSAISCFTRITNLKFDEEFGVGSKYAMGEELDFIMRLLNNKNKVLYHPAIEVWHPELNVQTMSKEKVYNYAKGYGAIYRKNFSLIYFIFFSFSFAYIFAQMLLSIFLFNKELFTKRMLGLKGRIIGFLYFKK